MPSQPQAGDDQQLIGIFETELNGEYMGVGFTVWNVVQGNAMFGDESNPQTAVSNLAQGINELVLASANGNCPLRFDSVFVEVLGIVIPNGFSPNGDEVNDTFAIEGIETFGDCSLNVFNRWGKKVFESGKYSNEWDGSNSPDDTYFYELNLSGQELTGFIVIQR